MANKKWQLSDSIPEEFLNSFPEYPKLILKLLYDREIRTQEAVDEFFNSDYITDLNDPYLFSDMDKSVKRIIKAIESKERIVIYGDYDADGICGSAILHSVFTDLNANFDVYIPNRSQDGYGLNQKALDAIVEQKTGLIVTVDCGSTDVTEVEFAKTKNIDVIITDHHLMPAILPKAYAIINPKREGETYPFKVFCGAGVAFKLACAILRSDFAKSRGIKIGQEKWLLDLVAIATVADMVPLISENRTLVKYGLIVIEQTKRLGLKKLMESFSKKNTDRVQKFFKGAVNIDKKEGDQITTDTIAFLIAPRINATSRMNHATTSFELLITNDEKEAERLVGEIEDINSERRKAVDQILKEAEEMLEAEIVKNGDLPKLIFVGSEKWEAGVVGLVSGRISDKYNKPAFIYGKAGADLKGSCRSISGFNVVEIMGNCQKKHKDLLLDFGGHAMAGGFSLYSQNLDNFKKCLIDQAEEYFKGENLVPVLDIDVLAIPNDINWELFDWLLKLEPFGCANRKPVFLIEGVTISSIKWVGEKANHMKATFKSVLDDGSIKLFNGIGFGLLNNEDVYQTGDLVDVVFILEVNEWNGTRELQLKIKDIKHRV